MHTKCAHDAHKTYREGEGLAGGEGGRSEGGLKKALVARVRRCSNCRS